MTQMTKDELKTLIEYEVYGDRKIGAVKRVWLRMRDSSKDAVFLLRKYQFYSSNKARLRAILTRNKLIHKYGIFVEPETSIGKGLKLLHPNGIIFGKRVKIGDNCKIFQQVTIGSKNNGDSLQGKQPSIGDNCTLFAGAKILGDICVASGTSVGANAVLMKSTEENSVYAGVPASRIK